MNDEIRKNINDTIEKELGISYDEFELLDYDEQQKLMEQNRRKKKINSKIVSVMIGSGEHATFIDKKCGETLILDDGTVVMVGDTPEQSRKRLEDRMDDAVYTKPVALMKKIKRRIVNR